MSHTRRRLLYLVACTTAVAALGLGVWLARRGPSARREPGLNVLLVTVDTLRADALGAYGRRAAATPWMDRLAKDGARFADARAHNVVTLPSHASILSGLTPIGHGIRDNAGFRFPANRATLATVLRGRGYRTGAFVSAFPLDSRFGLDRGFDVYDDAYANADTEGAFVIEERRGADTVARALEWMKAQGGGPFFAWVHVYDPHFPYDPPPSFAASFATEPYHGEVAAADAALAPLLEPLLAAGRDGRTLVALTADHGESLGEHGEMTHGIFAYEATLRVPLVFFAPRLFRPTVVEETARLIDVAPTILDALEAPVPPEMEGRSLLPALGGERLPPADHYFEALSAALNRGWAPLHGIVREGAKYVDLPLPEIYDLRADPAEGRNLAASDPQRLEILRGALAILRRADPGWKRDREAADVRERLAALGYITGADAPSKERYTDEDDPKRLIALDAQLQSVVERYKGGDLAGAIALCEQVVAQRPDMPVALSHLALLRREAGDIAAAVAALERALALNPADTETAALLGNYLNEAGQSRKAAALLEPYAAREPPDIDVLIALGVARAGSGRPEEALALFERARATDPTNPLPLVNVATVHLATRRFGPARQALEAALALNPRVARAHNALGVVAAETGRPEDAIAHWKRAVELEPSSFDTLFNLGSVLVKSGRGAEARPYLERFAREAPPALYAPDVARVRAWLAGLEGG